MWNPVIRYLLLNSLKINYSAACVFKHTDAGAWSQFVAVLMLVGINVCPLILSRILYKNNGVLEDKEKVSKIGTLYEGKNVPADRKHRVWIYPLVFFFRRSLFIVGTLVLFDYPALQMVVHQLLSLAMLAYMLKDQYMFIELTH